jgi:hypothetical protein
VIELDCDLLPDTMGRMKIQPCLRITLAGVLLLFLNACATTAPTAQGPLVGTWTNSLGTVWTVKADGTFDVDVVNPARHIVGNYTVAGDTITVQETGGKSAKGCGGPGVYKFTRTGDNTLTFKLVSDTCKERKKNVLLAWHKK